MGKFILLLLISIVGLSCNSNQQLMKNKSNYQAPSFIKINDQLSFAEFEQIKHLALNSDCVFIFRSYDNYNPCYDFGDFKIYFGADDHRNINNDPNLSDFNQLVIYNPESAIQYYHLIIVREGDIKAGKNWLKPGMEDDNIYLVDLREYGIEKMLEKLPMYLKTIKKTL